MNMWSRGVVPRLSACGAAFGVIVLAAVGCTDGSGGISPNPTPSASSSAAMGVVSGTARLCLAIVRAVDVPPKPVLVVARHGGSIVATQTVQSSGRKPGQFRFSLAPGRYLIAAPRQHDGPVRVTVAAGQIRRISLVNACK